MVGAFLIGEMGQTHNSPFPSTMSLSFTKLLYDFFQQPTHMSWKPIMDLFHYVWLGLNQEGQRCEGGREPWPLLCSFLKSGESHLKFLKFERNHPVYIKWRVVHISDQINHVWYMHWRTGNFITETFNQEDKKMCLFSSQLQKWHTSGSLSSRNFLLSDRRKNWRLVYHHYYCNTKQWEAFLSSMPVVFIK